MAGNSFYLDAVTRAAGSYDYRRSVSGRYAASEIIANGNTVSDFRSLMEEEEGFWERRARINREYLEAREENARINKAIERRVKQNSTETVGEGQNYIMLNMAELLFSTGKDTNTGGK